MNFYQDLLANTAALSFMPLPLGMYHIPGEITACMTIAMLDCEQLEAWNSVLFTFVFAMHEKRVLIKYILMNE